MAEARAATHLKLTVCDVALDRIQFSENRYVLVDGQQLTAKPLHVETLINSIYIGDNPRRQAWVYMLCHRWYSVAAQSEDEYVFKEACRLVDKYKEAFGRATHDQIEEMAK